MGSGDGREVASEKQIDVFHRQHLAVAAAARAPFNPEYRPKGRFANCGDCFFAQPLQALSQADGDGCLSFASGSWCDGRDENQFAFALRSAETTNRVHGELGFVVAKWFVIFTAKTC